jgi:P27 family predicted phage terminase small subunit
MTTGQRPGRPAKPLEVHRRNGNPGKRARPPAPTPETALAVVTDQIPSAPSRLGQVGTGYWVTLWTAGRRHLSELHDSPLLLEMCLAFEDLQRLQDWLAGDVSRRWYETANGQIVTHPAVKQVDQLRAQLTTWLSLIGFTPSDRSRLGLLEVRVANELDEFRRRKRDVVDAEEVSEV